MQTQVLSAVAIGLGLAVLFAAAQRTPDCPAMQVAARQADGSYRCLDAATIKDPLTGRSILGGY